MIRLLIKLYIIALMADAILSYFPATARYSWRLKLKKLCNYTCDPVRKHLPHHLPIDVSPLIVIFALYLFTELFHYLW